MTKSTAALSEPPNLLSISEFKDPKGDFGDGDDGEGLEEFLVTIEASGGNKEYKIKAAYYEEELGLIHFRIDEDDDVGLIDESCVATFPVTRLISIVTEGFYKIK